MFLQFQKYKQVFTPQELADFGLTDEHLIEGMDTDQVLIYPGDLRIYRRPTKTSKYCYFLIGPTPKEGENIIVLEKELFGFFIKENLSEIISCIHPNCQKRTDLLLATENNWTELHLKEKADILSFVCPDHHFYGTTLESKIQKLTEFIKREEGNDGRDAWICICGNNTSSGGFYTCDYNGMEMEPLADSNWDNLYVCGDCGRIIEGMTLKVIGRVGN